ncbi:DUF2514 domain-containing protein [Pseudomonas promysalinigenes]|uniref:DUF2514 domain-containing protein n=1 Tax=Pseudomonas promysalinigenes TaxID=485898 RepID=A0ABY6AVC9_9PSED|nr:DUF2514 domain-containing protein [Pseudomonas promysalinigenes]UXH41648.1 DUF2514 domain-containing protein [Pseudomonas promysalinigenes]
MSWLGAVPAWRWWLIALVLVAGGQQYRVMVAQGETATARADLADYRLQVAERDRRAAAQVRTEEQRQQKIKDQEDENARREKLALQGDVDRYRAAGVGLQQQIDRLQRGRGATCDLVSAQQRETRPTTSMVCGQLLGELDQMAGSLGEALGRSRIAGLGCEAILDGIKSR